MEDNGVERKKRFFEGFPNLFGKEYIRSYLEFESGWDKIVEDLCQKLEEINSARTDGRYIRFIQVKEKFAQLRIYYSCPDDIEEVVSSLVRKAMEECSKTCEVCGKPGKEMIKKNSSWLRTVCDECAVKGNFEDLPPVEGEE